MTVDATFWDGVAEKYAAQPVGDPAAFERKIAITKAMLSDDAVTLDVGCGTGSFALILAPDVGHAHGLDISGEMLRIARGKAANVDNVTFHQGVLKDAPFEPGAFDLVSMYSLLHLVPDRAATLRAGFGLLRPGGALVTSTVCLGNTWMPYAPMIAVMRWFGKAPEVSTISEAQLREEIETAGFVDVQVHDVGAEKTVSFITARKPGA